MTETDKKTDAAATFVKAKKVSTKKQATLRGMLKSHFLIRIKGKTRIGYFDEDGILGLSSKTDFDLWFADVGGDTRKSFLANAPRFDGTILAPGGYQGDKLNLWRGWAVEPKPGDWTRIQLHMLYYIADNNEEFYFYLHNWIIWTLQNPDKQAEVALVLRGPKGAGKGAFVYALSRLFNPAQYKHLRDRKHLVGAFNAHLASCCLLFADEAYWPGQKDAEGALKGLITERDIPIEPKGVDLFMVKNNLHVIIAGNEKWLVPASEDERRYAVIDVNGKWKRLPNDTAEKNAERKAYFDALIAEIEGDGPAAMLHYALNFDLKGWHPRDNVPQTAALDQQRQQSRDGITGMIEQLCHDACLPCAYAARPNVAITTGADDYREGDKIKRPYTKGTGGFWGWAKDHFPALKYQAPQQMLAELKHEWGFERKGFKSGNLRGITFPPLAELRATFESKIGIKQEWQNDAADWEGGEESEAADRPPEWLKSRAELIARLDDAMGRNDKGPKT